MEISSELVEAEVGLDGKAGQVTRLLVTGGVQLGETHEVVDQRLQALLTSSPLRLQESSMTWR